ncbi:MAG: hypothetical protein L0Z53_14250, partial [Acidobacteriales bacterium]|nr:hypothetical protein [Terriglobales bacterium]
MGGIFAQVAPPAQPFTPETTVATLDEKKITAGELQALMQVLPLQAQENAVRDPKAFLRQIAMMRKLSAMAVENKLDQQA